MKKLYKDWQRYKMSQWEILVCKFIGITFPTMVFIELWWF